MRSAKAVRSALVEMRIALASDAANRRARILRWTGVGAAMLAIGLGAVVFEAPRNHLIAVATGNRAPTLDIGIQFKDLHPIHQQRSTALETGRLVVSDDDFAPVTLEINGQSVQARLRLAAGPIEDLAGEKWPMRLRAAKGEHLFGQRAMTVTPVSSQSLIDALFLEHLERLEGLSARFLLVDAVLNGRRLGTMALAELPSTELLERQQRRDGVVVRVDKRVDVSGDASRVAVALDPKRIAGSRQLTAGLVRAENLVAAAIDRTRPADQLFDAESMGRFLAVAEHWNRTSLLDWDQLRLYLNPMTSRLEPIGAPFSVSSTENRSAETIQPLSITETPFMKQMLANPKIRSAFEATRREIATEFADGSAWKRATDQERSLRRLLDPDDPRTPDDGLASLRSVRLRDAIAPSPFESGTPPVAAPEALNQSSDPLDPLPPRSVKEVLARHPFLDWDHAEQMFRARPGNWDVRGSIILPDGAGLQMPGGTVLRFEPRAGLIARGPLRFEGLADAPIVLEGPPGTKRSQLWSGVYVIESDQASHWKHVVIRNTSGFKRAGWSLPGGVVFRKTHVELDHCAFLTSLADDALNLVRATFALRDIEVRGAASDAVDFDYSEGRIEGAFISHAAGDGFDLGGSRVEMSGARLTDIEDKAVSVGERSELVVQALDVDRVSIGIASKNSSRVRVSDSTFRRVSLVGLIAYRNQTVYDSAAIFSDGNRFEQTARHALAELGSRIVVDGAEWPVADISIASVAAVAATE